MKFYFVLELFTCCFFITSFIGAVPIIVKDKTTLVTGETVELTCTITGYAAAQWKKGSSAALTTCVGGSSPSCSPIESDRYTFSTTQDTITVHIANLNRADDGATWMCYDAGATETSNIVLDPILTQQSGYPALTEASECQTITCESSCIAPFASSDVSFTWKYIPDGKTAQDLYNPSTVLTSSSDGCPSSEEKVKSTLTNSNKPTGLGFSDHHVKFQCDFSQNDFTSSSWTATSNECFKADGSLPIVGIVVGSIYVLSWIIAAVVNLVIYKMNQMRLAWHLCNGPMKRLWIWLLLFIFLPYIPSGVAIYLFRTKRPGKPTKPVISPNYVSVNVGDPATFTCTSSSTTYPAQSGLTMFYTWRRNRVDMKSGGRYMVSGQTLTVTKVVKGDASDTFTCLAREGSGLTSDESDSARIVISKPTKPVISPQSVSVHVGGTAKFTCTSSSTTDPAESDLTMIYTWRRNRVDLKSEGPYMVSGQTLTVTNVMKKDCSDTFTCLVREDNGLTSDESDPARIVISKPTKPVISPNYVSVNVGDTATFTCTSSSTTYQAQSGLTMNYTWRRNRVDMKSEGPYMVSGQTLTVTKVIKGDASDIFTCIAREEYGLPSDESDSAKIVIIAKPTSGTKPGNYGESEQSMPLLPFNE